MNKLGLSIIVHTKNSHKTLRRCLMSCRFADELIVCDMQSSDNTVSIAQDFTSNILSVKDVGYVEPARNTALKAATQPWIFIVDADEEIPKTLQQKVKEIVQTNEQVSIYIPRKNLMFGAWIDRAGWWPDYQLRLFPKGCVTWSSKIHSSPAISTKTWKLPIEEELAIIHHNYQNIEQFLERSNRYSSIQAVNKNEAEYSPAVIFETFKKEFFQRMFAERGYRGSVHVQAAAFLQMYTELISVLKSWEANEFSENETSSLEMMTALRAFQQELWYWICTEKLSTATPSEKWYWKVRRKLRI